MRIDVDRIAAEIAAGQHGVVTRAQLLEAGASSRRIQRRVGSGSLRPMHPGVYRVGPVESPLARFLAACLACGPGSTLSHSSAARLWEVVGPAPPSDPIDVTITRSNRRHVGLRVRRSRTLAASERTHHRGVPVTTPARTLLDLAAVAPVRTVERALAESLALRIATIESVRRCVEAHPYQPGAIPLRRVLDSDAPVWTRSEAEERLLHILRSARVPPPRVNARVGPFEVDFYWPDAALVVEVDGFAAHGSRRAFERDRRRDARLAGLGLRVIRFTWRQIESEPGVVVFRLGQAMAVGK